MLLFGQCLKVIVGGLTNIEALCMGDMKIYLALVDHLLSCGDDFTKLC